MNKVHPMKVMKQFFLNPVIDKEYRLRMRSSKAMWTLLAYLIAIGLFSAALFAIFGTSGNDAYGSEMSGMRFIVLSFAQLGLIAFMSPALTAGVISSEREKQTLNLLLTTQQSSFNIIISKLLSSIGFMLLIVFSTLPLYGIVFLYGGISPDQLISVFGFFIFNMFVFGSFGVLFSTLFKRTILAIIVTYGVVLFMFAGTAILFLLLLSIFENGLFTGSSSNSSSYQWLLHLLALNPGFAMFSIFEDDNWYLSLVNAGGSTNKTFYDYVPFWLEYMIVYTVVLACTLYGAIRKLRPVRRGKKGV